MSTTGVKKLIITDDDMRLERKDDRLRGTSTKASRQRNKRERRRKTEARRRHH